MLNTMGRALTVLIAAGAMLAGCALDKGDYNYVQPGTYVKKSELLGKSFYLRSVVVDTKAGASGNNSVGGGDWLRIERVRFEVQEDKLVGYKDYELAPGTEEAGYEDSEVADYGSPHLTIPIRGHFDIQRRYNSSTGEETNVISKNMSDRPWHEREYMDIAIGSLRFQDFIFFDYEDYWGANAVSDTSVAHIDDATNPFRPRIDLTNGYMDVVQTRFLAPDIMDCWNRGFSSPLTCGAGQVKIRTSFMEVNEAENAGYQPLHYPDSVPLLDDEGREMVDPETGEVMRAGVQDRFGIYRMERTAYDRERGMVDSNKQYYATRLNIWEKSVNEDGTLIPYAERTPKTIHYYLNWDFPVELLPTAMEVGEEWNGVFKRTVASVQNKNVEDVQDMFVVHRNRCNASNLIDFLNKDEALKSQVQTAVCTAWGESDDASVPANCETRSITDVVNTTTIKNFCAAAEYFTSGKEERFEWAQIGDNRYNMMNWITQITSAGWSGFGPMFADPTNGRSVVAAANVLGWSIDRQATRALEYIDYMNGKLSLEDVLQGASVPSGYSSPEFNPGSQLQDIREVQENAGREAAAAHMQSLERRFSKFGDSPEETLTPLENGQHFHERLERLAGSEIESEWLIRDEDLMVASALAWEPNTEYDAEADPMGFYESLRWSPGMGVDPHPAVREKASHLTRMRDFEKYIEAAEMRKYKMGYDPEMNLDDSLVGLAEELKDTPRDEALLYLRKALFKAVMLHEVGHNVGMIHNWQGSYDSLNYHDEFWDLETSGLEEATKLAQRQPEYKASSIMDYNGVLTGDFQGLGKYDEAAVKFAYGQIIERFTDANDGGESLRRWRLANDYRKLPDHLGGTDALKNREDVIWDWTNPDQLKQTYYTDLTATEVPYMYCVWNGDPTCRPFDFGANYREIQAANRVKYKNYFIFSNFLRNRASDMGMRMSAFYRGQRAFYPILQRYQWMYYYRANQDKLFDQPFFETDLGQDLAAATADGLNLMAEVIGMPEPGRYYKCTDDEGGEFYYPSWYISFGALDQEAGSDPVGYGFDRETCVMNPYTNSTVFEPGDTQPTFLGLTDDYTEWAFSYMGTYWDKDTALNMLAYPRAWFPRGNNSDITNFVIPFTRLYEEEIYNVMSSVITGDRKAIGSSFNEETGEFVPRQLVNMTSSLDLVGNSDVGTSGLATVVPPMLTNLQRYGLLYGTALMTSPFDSNLDFAKHLKVSLKGAMDDVDFFGDSFDVAECTMPDSGLTYRASQLDYDYAIGYQMVQECAQHVATLETINYDMVEAKREEREEAFTAWQADDDNEALRDAYLAVDAEYDEMSWRYSKANNGLTRVGQMLQFARLIHMYYEN